MSLIQKLPEELVAKIAAGEVIERPFSVVKELVENSIDGGATQIGVDVEEGGRRRITVIDDGIGMDREDTLTALERHATSKISSTDDLFRIRTLGFRGEALPSIAAVSHLTLESKKAGDFPGVRLEVEGGKIGKVEISSLPCGTRISVVNLFFNTPARLKFMKSPSTEFSHIAGWIEQVALGRSVGFVLRHNGRVELRSDCSDLRSRIGKILGPDVAEFLHPVAMARGGVELTGFVSDHRGTSRTPKSLFFYVNGRPVRDRTLQHATLSAYENLLMKHRYPWAILFLTVPPESVDVNVHPTKSEVRFANGSLVHELVRDGIRRRLSRDIGGKPVSGRFPEGPRTCLTQPISDKWSPEGARVQGSTRLTAPVPNGARSSAGPEGNLPETGLIQSSLVSPEFRIIGQAHGTYLICETADKLILIDQHAAHERIGFEKLKKEYETEGVQKQHLLIPQTFDLRPSQGEILKKYLLDLERVGIEVEFFGGNTFLLRALPSLLQGTDIVSLIEDLIESLQSFEKLSPLEERINEVLERIACHRQVRAGDRLTTPEIESLLLQMQSTGFSGQCPHGRPSVLEVPFEEIEKWFRRRG